MEVDVRAARRLFVASILTGSVIFGGPLAASAEAAPSTLPAATAGTTIYPSSAQTPAQKREFDKLVQTAQKSGFTKEQWSQAFRDLEASPLKRTESRKDGARVVAFQLDQGLTLELADPATVQSGVITPQISAGTGGYRNTLWLGFNQTDQAFIKGMGGIAAASAFCTIPAVGWVGCVFIQVAVLAATTYLWKNGICTQGRNMYYYSVKGGGTIACRNSPPPAFY